MYPVFSTSLFLLILGTTSFPGTLNFIGELFNMISLSIVDVVFNGLFVTSIPLTTSYSLFLFKRSCGNIYLNYRNQTMDVSRLYLWIPSAALFPLTDRIHRNTPLELVSIHGLHLYQRPMVLLVLALCSFIG